MARGCSPHGRFLTDEVYRQMIGLRLDKAAQLVRETYALSPTTAQLAAAKRRYFCASRALGVPVMPGLLALETAVRAGGCVGGGHI
ncbi:MAG: hypothetical protein M5U34_41750 [Chloroflexi bacterium]|nr:hypothetical protein [Chloroflexota bacterium]